MKNSPSQRLQNIFQQLPSAQQETLLAFAEFLFAQLPPKLQVLAEPKILPRPLQESVVAAIKRLSQSYPMLDKSLLFHDTSRLMTDHMLHGRDAVAVIDELEALFLRVYAQFLTENTTL
jgi:hypothetical protein